MAIVRLKIDVAGTKGDEAWRGLQQFGEIQSASFGPQFGSSGACKHPADAPHLKGEWRGAEIRLQTPLLAQYAVAHYLEQPRVLDADIVSSSCQLSVVSCQLSVVSSQLSVLSSQFSVLSSQFPVLSPQFSVVSSQL